MKKVFFLILLSTMIFCGCEFALDNENAIVFFSSRPITRESFKPEIVENTFAVDDLIHFCVYSKEPFKSNQGRIQIFKKDPKTQQYGFSLTQANDIALNPEKNYYTGSFTIYTEGYYLLRVFNKNSPNKPIAQNTFWVTQEN